MTAHPSDWRNATARTKWLALAAMIGILGGVVLTTYFSGAAARAVGPMLIARNSLGETLLANPTTLFLVAADGASAINMTAEELGLRGPVMSVASDGTDWFIGDDASGMLYRCDMAARQCVAALQTQGDRRIFRRAHAVAFAGDRIFLTDSEAHSLLVFDRRGQRLTSTRTGPIALCFPNGIVDVDGELYVADTNNFRIARLLVEDPVRSTAFLQVSSGEPLGRANCNTRSGALGERGSPVINTAIDSSNTVAFAARPPARQDRVWPVSVLRARSGEWWVIQMANRMRLGDVIRYDAAGNPIGRVDLPPEADPIELIEANGEILITDTGLTTVHRATLQGRISGEWGPPEFRASLRGIAAERDFNRGMHRLSTGVIAAGVLTAMLVVWFELRRQRVQGWGARGTLAPVTIQAGAIGPATIWIPLEDQARRRTKHTAWLLGICLLLWLAAFGYFARDLDLGAPAGRLQASVLALLFGLVMLVAGLALVNVARMSRRRLGVNRDEVRFESGSGQVVSSPWQDVRVGSRSMLLGRHIVQIVDPRGRYVYPQLQIETQLLSRLPSAAFVANTRMFLEALRRGNALMWMSVMSFAAYVAFLLMRLYRPEWMREMGARAFDWLR